MTLGFFWHPSSVFVFCVLLPLFCFIEENKIYVCRPMYVCIYGVLFDPSDRLGLATNHISMSKFLFSPKVGYFDKNVKGERTYVRKPFNPACAT